MGPAYANLGDDDNAKLTDAIMTCLLAIDPASVPVNTNPWPFLRQIARTARAASSPHLFLDITNLKLLSVAASCLLDFSTRAHAWLADMVEWACAAAGSTVANAASRIVRRVRTLEVNDLAPVNADVTDIINTSVDTIRNTKACYDQDLGPSIDYLTGSYDVNILAELIVERLIA